MALTDPVPSSALDVFKRNSEDTDKVVNQESGSVTTRTGKKIKSFKQMQKDADSVISSIESSGQSAIQALRIETPFTFTDGGTVTAPNQAILYETNARYYRWDGSYPHTVTSGTDPTSDPNWVDVGQAALRSELAETGSSVLISGEQASDVASVYEETVAAGARVKDIPGAALKTVSGEDKRTQNKAVVSFIFDDGLSNAVPVIESVFDARNITCGLAVTSSLIGLSSLRAPIKDLLSLQDKGYEILSHQYTERQLSAANSPSESEVKSELNTGYDMLVSAGFDIKGFVAVSSELDPSKTSIVFDRHTYGFTVYKGADIGLNAIQDYNLVLDKLFRTSLNVVGLEEAKNIVDLAIANDGYVQFYDHDPTQTQFPSSMSQADLEDLLDYCISQGVDIVNPRNAIDQVHSATIKGVSVQQDNKALLTDKTQHRNNLIYDTKFEDLVKSSSFGANYWNLVVSALATGDATFSAIDRGVYSECVINMDGNHSSVSGSIILASQNNVFYSNDMPRSICFSVKLRSSTGGFRLDYETTLRIVLFRLSDDSVLETIQTEPLYIDSNFREYNVSVSPTTNADFYVRCEVRVAPTSSNVAANIVVSKPALVENAKPEPWSQGVSPRDVAEFGGTYPSFTATSLADSTYVTLGIDAAVDNPNFTTNTDGTVNIKRTGVYMANANCFLSDASTTDGTRLVLAATLDGGSTLLNRRVEWAGSSPQVQCCLNFCRKLNAGDTLEIQAQQNSGVTLTTSTGSLSTFNLTRIG